MGTNLHVSDDLNSVHIHGAPMYEFDVQIFVPKFHSTCDK